MLKTIGFGSDWSTAGPLATLQKVHVMVHSVSPLYCSLALSDGWCTESVHVLPSVTAVLDEPLSRLRSTGRDASLII